MKNKIINCIKGCFFILSMIVIISLIFLTCGLFILILPDRIKEIEGSDK